MRFIFRFVLIVLIASIIDLITVESLGYVIQDIFYISDDEMSHLIYWGDTFFTRIIVSIVGTFIGGYIIGSHLGHKQRLATFVYTVPILFFWLIGLVVYYNVASLPHNLESPHPDFQMFSAKKLIPMITLIFTLPSAYLGNYCGMRHQNNYCRSYSIINIKWYNLIWYIPTIYSLGISVICMLVLTIFFTFWLGENPLSSSFEIFFHNKLFIDIVTLLSLCVILITSIKIFKSIYNYLSDNESIVRYKGWKIFGGTMYFWILFVFTFNLPDFFLFEFELKSFTERIEAVPKSIDEFVNLSVILFSGYVSQKLGVKILKQNYYMKNFLKAVNNFKVNLFKKIINK